MDFADSEVLRRVPLLSKMRSCEAPRTGHELRLIEQWGSGIQRMFEACREAGLEEPKLEEIGLHFRVTISTARVGRSIMDQTDRKIVSLVSGGAAVSTAFVAEKIGMSPRATLTRLRSLVFRGILVEIGTGPHDPKRKYALAG